MKTRLIRAGHRDDPPRTPSIKPEFQFEAAASSAASKRNRESSLSVLVCGNGDVNSLARGETGHFRDICECDEDIRNICDIRGDERWAKIKSRAGRDHVNEMDDDRLAKITKMEHS